MNLSFKNNHSVYGYNATLLMYEAVNTAKPYTAFVFHVTYPKFSLNKIAYHFECEIPISDDILKGSGYSADLVDSFKSLYFLNALLGVNDLHLLPKNLVKSLRDLRQSFVHPQAKLF